jgi:hypothetical protein
MTRPTTYHFETTNAVSAVGLAQEIFRLNNKPAGAGCAAEDRNRQMVADHQGRRHQGRMKCGGHSSFVSYVGNTSVRQSVKCKELRCLLSRDIEAATLSQRATH